jgi:hypothetical protein
MFPSELDCLVSVGSFSHNPKVLDLEQESQNVSHVLMIVDDQDGPNLAVVDNLFC